MNIEIEKNTEEFEEFEDDFDLKEIRPMYEVWLIGEDENNNVVDFEYFIDDFDSPVEAKKCMDFFADKTNLNKLNHVIIPDYVKHVYIQVETTIPDNDNDGTVNINTVYKVEII